jgi:hypothetical protein
MAVDAVSGRNTVCVSCSREGNGRPLARNALTVCDADPTRAEVSKKWVIVSLTCMSRSSTTAPT